MQQEVDAWFLTKERYHCPGFLVNWTPNLLLMADMDGCGAAGLSGENPKLLT